MGFLNAKILGSSLWQWAVALSVVVGFVCLVWLLRCFAKRSLSNQQSELELSRSFSSWYTFFKVLVAKTNLLILFVIGFYIASIVLKVPEQAKIVIERIFVVAILFQIGLWGVAFLMAALKAYKKKALRKNPSAEASINLLGLFSKIVLWSVLLLVGLDNLGVNVTALVTGLGIGGVAVALALQNVLGDLFASLSILLDKPFVTGDFLMIDDYLGAVEKIGLKTTRIRSLSGEQLVFSNSDLLKTRLRNFGRMYERRVPFVLGVTYETPREKLKMIPKIIRQAIESHGNTRFDRSNFSKYGDYALQFETVYYVLSADYNEFMDTQQAIYFDIHEQFEKEQIEFAYPTRKLFLAQAEAGAKPNAKASSSVHEMVTN